VVPLALPEHEDRRMVSRSWAAQRIRDLEVAELVGRRAAANEERIVRIALEHGIATSRTSFVVVEEREGDRRSNAQPVTRVVPVSPPAGWAMFGAAGGAARTSAGQIPVRMAAAVMPAMARAVLSRPRMAPPSGMPMPPPQSPMPAAPLSAKKGGRSLLGHLGDLISGAFSSGEADDGARAFEGVADSRPAMRSAGAAAQAPVRTTVEILEAQQASGLWIEPGPKPETARTIVATVRALLALAGEGIGTADPLHGGQVRKAVDALVALVAKERLSGDLAELALGAAWLAATGRRTRGAIERAIHAESSLGRLGAMLGSEEAVREHITLGVQVR
jgi:Ca-activated chloride channel family protein